MSSSGITNIDKKIRVTDAFYGMRGFYFNHVTVNEKNIGDFKLHLIFSSNTADIYSVKKRTQIKIIHVKDKNYPPEYRIPTVDWFESPVKEAIERIKKYESSKRSDAGSNI